jgi:2-iminoacetate synthase ThiH
MAGSQHGTGVQVEHLTAAATRAGRVPAQRDTLYTVLDRPREMSA